jgi:hypothetical protein
MEAILKVAAINKRTLWYLWPFYHLVIKRLLAQFIDFNYSF